MSVESLARAAGKLSDEDLLALHRRVTSLASKARLREPTFRARQQMGFTLSRDVMIANTRKRERCCLPGCTRFAYKATLCRKHWDDVPLADKHATMAKVMMAAHTIAGREHRRIAREAKARARASA